MNITKFEELQEIITNGENSGVEFKLDEVKPRMLAKEIVAFANSEGGMILIGIDDSGKVVGKSRERIEEWVMNICRDKIYPPIIPFYQEIHTPDGKIIAIVKIPTGNEKPYFVYHENKNTYYIRVGSTSREASRDELRRLYQSSPLFDYCTVAVTQSIPSDLDINEIKDYFSKFSAIKIDNLNDNEKFQIFSSVSILKKIEDKFVCTIDALLLFGKNPSRYLSQSGIVLAEFPGIDITEPFIYKKEFTGILSSNAEDIVSLIMKKTSYSKKIPGKAGKIIERYPREVLLEGLINALVHRDYTIMGAKIRVFLFNDRLEIKSPGKLPNTVTIEKMKIGISVHRNPFICSIMANKYAHFDGIGFGIPRLFKKMLEVSGREPLIRIEGEEVTLILYPCN